MPPREPQESRETGGGGAGFGFGCFPCDTFHHRVILKSFSYQGSKGAEVRGFKKIRRWPRRFRKEQRGGIPAEYATTPGNKRVNRPIWFRV